jgi:hypothetical protein
MVKAYARPEKEGFVLVTFFYGAGLATQARYTDWDQDFLGHTSEPRMKLAIPENEGTFDKRELRIVLPLDSFVSRASGGVPHSPIYVIIEELTQGLFTGDQSSQKILYAGRVRRTIKNYQGQNNQAAFFSLPIKSRLDIAMGLPCNHHCAWTLFKGGCGVTPVEVLAEIDSADGTEITVTTGIFTTPGSTDARYWKRGYAEKDGLRIAIRDYDGDVDTTKAYMANPVPSDWILAGAASIRFVPGCDKTVETCRARWNAEEFFLGLGYAIPAHQPNFETP